MQSVQRRFWARVKKAGLLHAFFSDVFENADDVFVASAVRASARLRPGTKTCDALFVGRSDVPRDVDNLLPLRQELIQVVDALLELG